MMSLLQDAHKTLFCWCLCLLHRSCLPGLSHRKVGVQRAVGTMHATPPVHSRAHHPRRGDRIAGPNHAPCFWVGVENQWRRSHAVALMERPWPYLCIWMGSNLPLNQVKSNWNCQNPNWCYKDCRKHSGYSCHLSSCVIRMSILHTIPIFSITT